MKKLILIVFLFMINCSSDFSEVQRKHKANKYEIYQHGVKVDILCTHRYIRDSFVEKGVYFKYVGQCDE